MEGVWAIVNTKNTDNIPLLKRVVEAVQSQVVGVIATDNDSRPEIKIALKELETSFGGFVTFIWNSKDRGLGASLTTGARVAIEQGATWILTLDDDSVAGKDMVKTMIEAYNALSTEDQQKIGLLTPNERTPRALGYPEGPAYINENGGTTAGQIVKASMLPKIGFWNEGLFIDHVDGEFCFRVRQNGFKTLTVPSVAIYTRPGNPVLKQFLGRTISIPNYRPYRYYYMCRNFTYMNVRKWKIYLVNNPYWPQALSTIVFPRFLVKMLLFEDNRGEKLDAALRGYRDGLFGRLGPMPTKTSKSDIINYDPIVFPERMFNRYLAFFGVINGNLSLSEFFPALFLSGKSRSKEVSMKRDEARLAYWKKSISKFLNQDGSITLFSHPFYTVSENYGELTSLIKEMIVHDQYATKEFIKDGDTIIDAGANIGMFSVKTAHDFPRAKIYAFEPSARTFAILKKNTAYYPNIICINRGLGDVAAEKTITQIDLGAAGGRLEDSSMGALQSPWEKLISETATITTLDAAVKEKVNFIKIDTEGYEAKILQGAAETIKRDKPIIAMSAYHNANDKKELPELLTSIHPNYVCELRHASEEDFICQVAS